MYKAPVDEIAFTLKHVAGMAEALEQGRLGDLSDTLSMPSCMKPAVLPPTKWRRRQIGDKQGPVRGAWSNGRFSCRTAGPSFIATGPKAVERAAVAPEESVVGLPHMLNVAALEMWNSGSWRLRSGRRSPWAPRRPWPPKWQRRAQGKVPAQDGVRRMDRAR